VIPNASHLRIENAAKGARVADRARLANRFWSRLIGLLSRSRLSAGEGLVLAPGNAIHTLFMRMAIDVIFVDKNGEVTKTAVNVRPFRMVMCPLRTRYTVELPVGVIEQTGTAVGDRIEFFPT
jgi:uncharacterized membrane protein (UPF0127 family)